MTRTPDITKNATRSRILRSLPAAGALLLIPIALYALDPNAKPGTNFDLSRWELAIPTGDTPTIISNTQLKSGWTDSYFFTNKTDGTMAMKDPGSNCTKFDKSNYCRTEFHEVDPSSGQETSWSPSGTNKLSATITVTEEGKGIVISQVFLDDSEHKPLAELEFKSGGDVYLNIEQSVAAGDTTPHYVGSASVGSPFSYVLSYTDNVLSITFNNGSKQVFSVPSSEQNIKAFFKAGNYGQSSDATEVHFSKLAISH